MDEQIEQNQNQPERQLSKKERRQMKREEKRKAQENAQKTKTRKNLFIWVALVILIAGGGFGVFRYLFSGTGGGSAAYDPLRTCINHTGVSMHIHPNLNIIINGELQDIPANIGISPGCMRPLHTHDHTGKLHVEFPRHRSFTLGEFFKVWDKPFSRSQIFDHIVDETHSFTVTVNGATNTDYENLVLSDGDQIEIKYGAISE